MATTIERIPKVRRIETSEADRSGVPNDAFVALPRGPVAESIPPTDTSEGLPPPEGLLTILSSEGSAEDEDSSKKAPVEDQGNLQEPPVEDNYDISKNFSGSFVATLTIKRKPGIMEPAEGWQSDEQHGALWLLPQEDDCLDIDEHNKRVKDYRNIAWAVSSIRCVLLEPSKEGIDEVVEIGWKTCWVPLHSVIIDNKDLIEELNRAKAAFAKKGAQAKANFRRRLPECIKHFISLTEALPETEFHIQQIHQYALLKKGDEEEEVVKAEFEDTFEHCSALFRSPELWMEVYKRRQEAVKALIRKHPRKKVFKDFLKRAQECEETLKKQLATKAL